MLRYSYHLGFVFIVIFYYYIQHFILDHRISLENFVVGFKEMFLYAISFLDLAAFIIFLLSLVFTILIIMCLEVHISVSFGWNPSCLLNLVCTTQLWNFWTITSNDSLYKQVSHALCCLCYSYLFPLNSFHSSFMCYLFILRLLNH